MTGLEHIEEIAQWFLGTMRPKYLKGQREHGGHLRHKRGALRNLEEEIIDMPVYFVTAKKQLKEMAEQGKSAQDAYEFLFGDEHETY
jgi:hypothetical protein